MKLTKLFKQNPPKDLIETSIPQKIYTIPATISPAAINTWTIWAFKNATDSQACIENPDTWGDTPHLNYEAGYRDALYDAIDALRGYIDTTNCEEELDLDLVHELFPPAKDL